MHFKTFWTALLAFPLAAHAVPPIGILLNKSSDVQVSSDAAATAAELAKDWGQFEFSVPRDRFPLPAPNCKGRIKIRLIALPPDAERRDTLLAERWSLLKDLRDVQAGRELAVDLTLDLAHYVQRQSDGTVRLKYCNAFSSGEFTRPER